jgi:hypothetical protein
MGYGHSPDSGRGVGASGFSRSGSGSVIIAILSSRPRIPICIRRLCSTIVWIQPAAQQALLQRARLNSLARQGLYDPSMDED